MKCKYMFYVPSEKFSTQRVKLNAFVKQMIVLLQDLLAVQTHVMSDDILFTVMVLYITTSSE